MYELCSPFIYGLWSIIPLIINGDSAYPFRQQLIKPFMTLRCNFGVSKGAVALSQCKTSVTGSWRQCLYHNFCERKEIVVSLNGMIGSCEAHLHMEAQTQCHMAEDIAALKAILDLF